MTPPMPMRGSVFQRYEQTGEGEPEAKRERAAEARVAELEALLREVRR